MKRLDPLILFLVFLLGILLGALGAILFAVIEPSSIESDFLTPFDDDLFCGLRLSLPPKA